jgi:thioredoxin 1
MVTELTESTFEKYISSNRVAIVDCWAEWCGPCRRMTPIIEEVSNELGAKAGVAKLNVDKSPAISIRFGIRAIPTLLIFKDGVLVDTLVGLRGKEDILDSVARL